MVHQSSASPASMPRTSTALASRRRTETLRPSVTLSRPATIAAAVLLIAATLGRPTLSAQSQGDVLARGWSKDGVVWNDSQTSPTLEDLAKAAAPVLWFSPDEFLLKENRLAPAALDQGEQRAVYYRAARIRTSGDAYRDWKNCLTRPSCRVTSDVSELTIRFMFYYPEDRGFGPHQHDVEVADVRFVIAPSASGSRAHIAYVAGAAHGVGWYTNEFAIDNSDGVMLPLHLFVEEGKHATAPDHDGDGVYDPRRDVNQLPFDAWGVRDTAPFSFRMGSGFDPSMFKTRRPETQVWPEHNVPAGRAVPTYRLVHALSSNFCESRRDEWTIAKTPLQRLDKADQLLGFLEDKDFCEGPHQPSKNEGWPVWLGGTIIRPFGGIMERLSLAYRFDQGRSGFAMGGPLFRIPRFDGWLVARLNMMFENGAATTPGLAGTVWEGHTISDGVVQSDLFYTRSAGRLLDWYAAIGMDSRGIRETISGSNIIVDDQKMANIEGGVHVRFPLPDLWKRRLHVPFVGARVGVRTEPRHASRQTRMVFEFGLGAW